MVPGRLRSASRHRSATDRLRRLGMNLNLLNYFVGILGTVLYIAVLVRVITSKFAPHLSMFRVYLAYWSLASISMALRLYGLPRTRKYILFSRRKLALLGRALWPWL